MRQKSRTLVFILCGAIAQSSTAIVSVAAEPSLGIWTDREGKTTYAFLENHVFRFSGERRACLRKKRRPDSTIDQEVYDSITQIFGSPTCEEFGIKPAEATGAWETGDDICWLKDRKTGEKADTGNLMIYLDGMQCCLAGKLLGDSFVLTKVWQKESKGLLLCQNRLLIRGTKK